MVFDATRSQSIKVPSSIRIKSIVIILVLALGKPTNLIRVLEDPMIKVSGDNQANMVNEESLELS